MESLTSDAVVVVAVESVVVGVSVRPPSDGLTADQVIFVPRDLPQPLGRLALSGLDSHSDSMAGAIFPGAYRTEPVAGSVDDEFESRGSMFSGVCRVENLVALRSVRPGVGKGGR
jgi:hypothetical protein